MDSLNISFSTLTNPGERAVNEDCVGEMIGMDRLAFILCDGLGGHGNGDVASKFVVSRMQTTLERGFSIGDSIMDAQKSLLQKQIELRLTDSMKTTVTCLTIAGEQAQFGHVGDSRVYYFEKNKPQLRSLDHSIPQLLASRGEIKDKDIRFHPDRSRLIRVMGVPWDRPKYMLSQPIRVTSQTTFLLCSDGFWELIDEKMMAKTLKKSNTPEEWLTAMEQIINQNGRGTNMDNYSAIAVFIR